MFRFFEDWYVLPIVISTLIGYLITSFIYLEIDFRLWSVGTRQFLSAAIIVILLILFILKVLTAVKVSNGLDK